jgi:TetR/AcrR family transcriptional repressor of lmrAB and yxaGH operons
MPHKARAAEPPSPRAKLVLATLDLLRRSGLSGAGINHVVGASHAPKGSVYHYFPGGKQELVTEALREADRGVGENLYTIFRVKAPIGQKVRTLFTKTAAGIEANQFTKGCPVAAVTLDLDQESAALREVCGRIFDRWIDLIAQGLEDVPKGQRRAVAQLIFATLEGGLILSRACGAKGPLLDSGASLAVILTTRFGRRRSR